MPFYLSLEIIEVFLKSCSFSNDFPMNLAAPGLTSRLSSQKPNVDGGALGLNIQASRYFQHLFKLEGVENQETMPFLESVCRLVGRKSCIRRFQNAIEYQAPFHSRS